MPAEVHEEEDDLDLASYNELKRINLERYGQHSGQLLAWFSAYGAGLAATIFIKLAPEATECQLPMLRLALWLIVAAMALQALLVFYNKYTQWFAHDTPREGAKWTPWQEFNGKLTTLIGVDIAVDVVTLILLGVATWVVIQLTGIHIAA